MDLDEFTRQFTQLTGFDDGPMPWQTRLYLEFFDQNRLPAAADIPTGLGKTAIIALWFIAIRAGRTLPRRLIYVVDRRAVVDQATEFIESLKERLPEGWTLPVSTLRGKHADNREWLIDPSKPAVVVGTVDMIGSRLLFEGYGVSRRMRPYQAGLLGADTLVVLDEAHLVPPFERLLADIESDRAFGPRAEADRVLVPGLKLLSLSATGREREGEVFRLKDDDLGAVGSLTRQRLTATKVLTLREGDPKSLADDLAKTAWDLTGQGERPVSCLIYCHRREDAEKTYKAINKLAKTVPVELFTGGRRGYERDHITKAWLGEHGFLADSIATVSHTPRFLVATSAGEVGIDLDADHMVCDQVPWERMVQRLGRVNRRGNGAARVVVIDSGPVLLPKKPSDAEKERIERTHRRVRELLESLPEKDGGHDVSPGAIRDLKQQADAALCKAMEEATTPPPLRPALTRPLLDAWSMTTLVEHTGRPEVAPWLRGWGDDDPQTTVLWREHLPIPASEPRSEREREKWQKTVTAYFEATPLHVNEQLETETWRVAQWLMARAKVLIALAEKARSSGKDEDKAKAHFAPDDTVAAALTSAGEFSRSFRLVDLANSKEGVLISDLAGKTLVLHRRYGGLSEGGTLEEAADDQPAWVADDDADWPQELRKPEHRVVQWRVIRVDGETEAVFGADWHKRFEFVLERDGEGGATSRLVVLRSKQSVEGEKERAIGFVQHLHDHQRITAERASEIAQRLGLPERYTGLLTLAARLHDEGKRSSRWQRAFNAPLDGAIYAKTLGPINHRLLDGYRHEFGSLLHVERDSELTDLEPDDQDLVLHLIAAHHGKARPTIEVHSCEAAPPSVLESRACQVALRFARLQRRWGPWGLAWWEAILRAADQQASRNKERGDL